MAAAWRTTHACRLVLIVAKNIRDAAGVRSRREVWMIAVTEALGQESGKYRGEGKEERAEQLVWLSGRCCSTRRNSRRAPAAVCAHRT